MVVSFIGGGKPEYPEKATDLSYLITRGRDIQHLNDKHAQMECLSAEVESTAQASVRVMLIVENSTVTEM